MLSWLIEIYLVLVHNGYFNYELSNEWNLILIPYKIAWKVFRIQIHNCRTYWNGGFFEMTVGN